MKPAKQSFWQRQKESLLNVLKEESEFYKDIGYLGIEASKNIYSEKIAKNKKEDVDWSNPYEVLEKHKKISEGQRRQCFFAMNVNKKEMPGFLMITKQIHIAPPLFGVKEIAQEPKHYKEEKFLHSREEP